MLPVNSIFLPNRIISNIYYEATKRSILKNAHFSTAASRTNLQEITLVSKNPKLFNQPIRFASNNIVSDNQQMQKQNHVEGIEPKSSVKRNLASSYFQRFPNYCQMVHDAKSRARRSILIDHCGIKNIDIRAELNNVEHVYSIEKETKRGVTMLSLIEFKTENDAQSVANKAKHNEGLLPIPLTIIRYNGQAASDFDNQDLPFPVDNVRLSYKESATSLDSFSKLLASNMMSLIALKMRFITLVNFERILCSGLFDEYELMPFGSSVIDLGTDSGDLDVIVTRKEGDHLQIIMESLSAQRTTVLGPERRPRLLHLDKSLYSEHRDSSGIKVAMKWFDYVLREYMPLTDRHNVVFVPQAKVPIIKFTSRVTGIDCDLSFNFGLDHRDNDLLTTGYCGIIMAQILYSLCRHNNLFTAVVVYLRTFAKSTNITTKRGVGFTNFQFLSLIIFYLQQLSMTSQQVRNDMNPSSQQEFSKASREKLIVEHRSRSKLKTPVIPSFRDLIDTKLPAVSLDDEQLDQLLPSVITQFFEFYSNFDFDRYSLNLYTSEIERKLDNSTLYVLNPIDRTKNICHNVKKKDLDVFLAQIRLALQLHLSPLDHLKIIWMDNKKQATTKTIKTECLI